MIDNEKILIKWLLIIEAQFGYRNDKINKILCIYSEWYSYFVINCCDLKDLKIKFENLKEIFDKIKEKIHIFDRDNRVEILGEFLNPYSGLIEYKLSTGEYINKGDKVETGFNAQQMLELFGEDFIKFYSIGDYRDIQINKVL